MISSLQETLNRIEEFADSLYLAGCLRQIAEDMEEGDETATGYYLREAAENLDGLYVLLRELERHIKITE